MQLVKSFDMGRTSSAVKRRYNAKTYTRWAADLRNEDFEKVENLRGDMSRTQFLKFLIEHYLNSKERTD